MSYMAPADTRLDISTNISGTGAFDWATLAYMTSYQRSTQPAGSNSVFYFGSTSPITSTQGKVTTYTVSGFRDEADTDGQEEFVDAAEAEPPVDLVLAVIRDWDTPASISGYYQQITPTAWDESGERSGDFIEVSFTATAAGERVKFTGGLPASYS